MSHADSLWRIPPTTGLTLASDEIHVWRVFLDQSLSLVEQYVQILSEDEQMRARRFHFARDQHRFIVGRGLLRKLLANYLKVEPGSIQFSYDAYGKPALTTVSSDTALHFNLSHSEGLALYAFAKDRRLGVDVEYVRPIAEAKQIATRFFSAQENRVLDELPPSEMHKRFFLYWTRKEAYLKALGGGLSHLEDYIDMPIIPEQEIEYVGIADAQHTLPRWSALFIDPAPGYVAALAVQERNTHVVYWQG